MIRMKIQRKVTLFAQIMRKEHLIIAGVLERMRGKARDVDMVDYLAAQLDVY